MDNLRNLIRDVHRRSLWQVLAIYLGASWGVLEAVDHVVGRLALASWMYGLAVVLLLIGLPIVLATAFVQEAPAARADSPLAGRGEHVVDEDDDGRPTAPGRPPTAAHRVLTWRNAFLGGVAAFALLTLGAGGARLLAPRAPAEEDAPRVVAALPFENMSPDPDDAYFTDGVHEEILAQLAGIGSLRVISRTSVMEYRETTKKLRTIAEELGARYVLEGSVRRFDDRVKVTAQLIDAATDQHLWAATYERRRDDLFAIQADVAEQITRALETELSPEERAWIVEAPTGNTLAHDLYLEANDYVRSGYSHDRRGNEASWRVALDLYEEAVERDTTFALGFAALAVHRVRLRWYGFENSEENLDDAHGALQRALRLAPDRPEILAAEGIYHYWGRRAYDVALRSLESAGEGAPAFVELAVPAFRGFILRRQGRFEESLAELRAVVETDPRDPRLLRDVAALALILRRFDLARAYLERAAALAPTDPVIFSFLGELKLLETGDPRLALAELGRFRGAGSDLLRDRVFFHLYAREYDAALAALEAVPDTAMLDHQVIVWPVSLLAALVHRLEGEEARAREGFGLARRLLERAVSQSEVNPRHLTTLALAKAGLGLRDEALADARRATKLVSREVDAYFAPVYLENLAWTHLLLGELADAIEILEGIADGPRQPAVHAEVLRLDPRWDPLRGDPRFQKLLEPR